MAHHPCILELLGWIRSNNFHILPIWPCSLLEGRSGEKPASACWRSFVPPYDSMQRKQPLPRPCDICMASIITNSFESGSSSNRPPHWSLRRHFLNSHVQGRASQRWWRELLSSTKEGSKYNIRKSSYYLTCFTESPNTTI
jgi:hypothetical protein